MLKLAEALQALGRRSEARGVAQAAAAVLDALPPEGLLAPFYFSLGTLSVTVGANAAEAQSLFERAMAALEHSSEPQAGKDYQYKESALASRIAFQLAMTAGMQGHWPSAVEQLEQALTAPRALQPGDRQRAVTMLQEARQRASGDGGAKKAARRKKGRKGRKVV